MERKHFFGALLGTAFFLVAFQPTSRAADGASLILEKKVNHTAARPGDILSITVIVRNISEQTAIDVRVTDTLPAGVTFDTGSSERVWTFGDLAAGTSAEQVYDARIASDMQLGDVVTMATASASNAESVTQSQTLEITSTLPATGADWRAIAILLCGITVSVLAGYGMSTASRLPALTEQNDTTYGKRMTLMPKHGVALLLVVFIMALPLSAFAEDPITSTSITLPPTSFVVTTPNLLLTTSADRTSLFPGERVTVSAHIKNDSEVTARNIQVKVKLPNGFSFLNSSSSERLFPVADMLEPKQDMVFPVDLQSDSATDPGEHTIKVSVTADDVPTVKSTIELIVKEQTGTVLGATTELPATGVSGQDQAVFLIGLLLLMLSSIGLRQALRIRGTR